MKFKEYIIKFRIDPLKFARENDIGLTSVYRYINGGRASLEMAIYIEKITEGKVTVEDLREENECKKKKEF